MDYSELQTRVTEIVTSLKAGALIEDSAEEILRNIDKHIQARMLAVAEDFEAQASNYEQAAKESDNERLGAWYSGRAASYTASARRMRNEQTL